MFEIANLKTAASYYLVFFVMAFLFVTLMGTLSRYHKRWAADNKEIIFLSLSAMHFGVLITCIYTALGRDNAYYQFTGNEGYYRLCLDLLIFLLLSLPNTYLYVFIWQTFFTV